MGSEESAAYVLSQLPLITHVGEEVLMIQQLKKLLFVAFGMRLAESRGRRLSLLAFYQP